LGEERTGSNTSRKKPAKRGIREQRDKRGIVAEPHLCENILEKKARKGRRQAIKTSEILFSIYRKNLIDVHLPTEKVWTESDGHWKKDDPPRRNKWQRKSTHHPKRGTS